MDEQICQPPLFEGLFPDEEAARACFEQGRWPHGPVCPSCNSMGRAYWVKTVRRWQCAACFQQFTVTANTPMHRTHLPLQTWARAIYLMVTSPKLLSAVHLSEVLAVSYDTAWNLRRRIRVMLLDHHPLLSGIIDVAHRSTRPQGSRSGLLDTQRDVLAQGGTQHLGTSASPPSAERISQGPDHRNRRSA